MTNTNGEIIALTSGGYGAVTINKGVQITAPTGVYAAITVSSGDAITVDAAGAVVVLRGLTLNSLGALNGINVTAVGALHIEGCIVNGFGSGIQVLLTADFSQIFIKDTIVRNNVFTGIFITTTTGTVRASINGCRSENNGGNGFYAYTRSRVTVSNSVAAGNSATGFYAVSHVSGATAEMNADHCVSSNNFNGFYVESFGGGTATMRVARSTVTNNTEIGFKQFPGGTFQVLAGTNMVEGNGTNKLGTITAVGTDTNP